MNKVGGAKGCFGRIQGDEAGESPQWALTAESTLEAAKIAIAQRVAQLLGGGGVALALRDRCGYRSDSHAWPTPKICSNATHFIHETASYSGYGQRPQGS